MAGFIHLSLDSVPAAELWALSSQILITLKIVSAIFLWLLLATIEREENYIYREKMTHRLEPGLLRSVQPDCSGVIIVILIIYLGNE